MAIKISVTEKGDLHIDGLPKKIDDLNQEFLENLVDLSLKSEVKYDLNGDTPLAKFFNSLKEGTEEGSKLRELMNEVEEKRAGMLSSNEQEDDSE